jgi:hypothetical protein
LARGPRPSCGLPAPQLRPLLDLPADTRQPNPALSLQQGPLSLLTVLGWLRRYEGGGLVRHQYLIKTAPLHAQLDRCGRTGCNGQQRGGGWQKTGG